MTKLLSTILILIAVGAIAQDAPAVIYKAAAAITIDGKLDEAAWQKAVKVPSKYFDKKGGPGISETTLANTQYCWDNNYLYIAYETFDTDLVAASTGQAMGPAGNKRTPVQINPGEVKNVDVVEFFITWGSTNFFWELHHNAANDFSDVWCVTADKSWPINDTKAFQYGIHFGHNLWIDDYNKGQVTLKKAIMLKPKKDGPLSTINDSTDVDTGYIAEIRLPIGSIAVPNKAEVFKKNIDADGRERRRSAGFNLDKMPIQILAVLQDMTSGTRYHHSSPSFKGGWFHHAVNEWNRFVFSE
ncbi:MAG: hypothetical protein ACI8W8_004662 [Rhodothermales bacterium]|jgi:hypothetical protein